MSIDPMTKIHLLLALGKLFNFSRLLFLYPKRGIESPFHRFHTYQLWTCDSISSILFLISIMKVINTVISQN